MYLGLDLGTSGLRGLLVDESGAAVGDASAAYDVATPHDGWSEQDPAHWIAACREVCSELQKSRPKHYAAIKGIGVAGHMHGATLLDVDGKIVRPCILWNDTRASSQAAHLDAIEGVQSVSGNIVFPGFTAPKLAWMAKHEPENFARIATVMLPKDYLVYWLTGRKVTEMSDASGSSWLDVGKRQWSPMLVEKSGMDMEQMPELIEGCDRAGVIRQELADELGLPPNVDVVGGGADNAAAACGIGAFREGEAFVSLGTSGVLLCAKDEYAPKPQSAVHTFCHAVPDKWYQMGVILSATDSLNWLAEMAGQTPQVLAASVPEHVSGPSTVRFLPYLSGERTPHNDAEIRGAFIGLSKNSDNAILCQAVMEGVSFALRDCLEALKSTGTNLGSAMVIGGGSNSRFWVETVANTLNIPLHIPQKGDFGAALGAARLAMIGAGGMDAPDVMTQPKIAETIVPNRQLIDIYDQAYQKYKTSYQAIRDIQ